MGSTQPNASPTGIVRVYPAGPVANEVGEAYDRLYQEWDAPRDAASAPGRPGSAPAAGTPAPQPQSIPAPPAGSSSQYDKYLKPMSCERAC